MSSEKPADLRYANNEERRFALAHLRWLAGGKDRRGSKPSPTHRAYALTEARRAAPSGCRADGPRRRQTPGRLTRMAVRKFAGEDELAPFREWVSQKPKGYVLNTDSGLSDRASTRVHRANCFTLELGFGGGTR
jgi:hypothetical protein